MTPYHRRSFWFALGFLLFLASFGQAQTVTPVIGPTVQAQFPASSDHSAQFAGTPVLTGYTLTTTTMNVGAGGVLTGGAIALSTNLGKPTPDAAGLITVPVPTLFSGLVNGIYTSVVSAVGPGGTTGSPVSDPFVKIGPPTPVAKPTIVAR